jgi:hypothetical protein
MFNAGKCPHCEKTITNVRLDAVTIRTELIGGQEYRGVSYYCPSCNSVLSVAMDPVSLESDIIDGVVSKLMKALGR